MRTCLTPPGTMSEPAVTSRSPTATSEPSNPTVSPRTNGNPRNRNHGRFRNGNNAHPKGDVHGLEDSPLVTAEENKTLRLSYKTVRNRIRAKVVTSVKQGHSDIRKLFKGVMDENVAIKDPEAPVHIGPVNEYDKLKYVERKSS